MTIVIGYEHKGSVYLGADSQYTAGRQKTIGKNSKVFIAHGIGYAFCGSPRMGQILQYHSVEVLSGLRKDDPFAYTVCCLIPMYRKILKEHGFTYVSNNVEEGGFFLIAFDGYLFQVESDFQVSTSDRPYIALGSGSEYAYGSLSATEDIYKDPRKHIEVALDVAKEFDTACGGDSIIIKV